MSETNDPTTQGVVTNSASTSGAGLVFGGQGSQTQQAQPAQPEPEKPEGKDALPEWAQKELEKARSEAADRRVKLRDLENQLKELTPLAEQARQAEEAKKTETDKLREQLEALKADQLKAQAEAETARKQAKLISWAAKAGVSPDVVELLDINKLDLEDEEATVAKLKLLSPAKVSGGGPSNPAGEQNGALSENDLRSMYFGGGRGPKNLIFGGTK